MTSPTIAIGTPTGLAPTAPVAVPRAVRWLVAAVVTLAAVAAALALVVFLRAPAPPLDAAVLGAALFVAAFFVLDGRSVAFTWRAHRTQVSISEIALFVGLVALPAALLVPLVAVPRAANNLVTRRPPLKAAFNVSVAVLATGAAAAVVLLLGREGVPAVVAAIPATAAHTMVADGLVSVLFGRLERESALRVYRERFLVPNALAIGTGIPAGLALVALHAYHPLMVLAAAPFAVVLVRHAALQARADRELAVHRRLAEEADRLIGEVDDGAIADRVLAAAVDLVEADGASLRLADGRAFSRGARPGARAPTEAALVGRDGRELGVLAAWERPARPRFGEDEAQVLRIVAGQAAHALESARALAEVAKQRDVIARQETLSSLGMLLAGVAHEINNPLTFMRLRVELAERDARRARETAAAGGGPVANDLAAAVSRHLPPIRQGLDRLEALSHSLKVIARPGDGRRGPVAVNDVIAHVHTVVRVGFKDLAFRLDLTPDLPPVHANAGEIHQVVLNLVKNAAEATAGSPGGGAVRVATRRAPDGGVEVAVEDDGPGVPPEKRAGLFTPFFTTKEKGTGLGLSISRQIADAHGGSLRHEAPEGGGARFVLALPAAASPEAPRDADSGSVR